MPSTKRKDRINRDVAARPNGKSSPGRYAEKARVGRILRARIGEAVASRIKGSKIPKQKKDAMRYGKHSSDSVVKNIHRHRALPTDGRDRPPGRFAYLAKFKKWQKARFGEANDPETEVRSKRIASRRKSYIKQQRADYENWKTPEGRRLVVAKQQKRAKQRSDRKYNEAFEPTDDEIVKVSKQVKKRSDKGPRVDTKKATMDKRTLAQIGASIRAKGYAAKAKSMAQDEAKEPKLNKISKKLHKSYHTFKMSKADKEKSDEVKKEVLNKKGIKEEAPGMKFFQKIMKSKGKDKKKDKKSTKKLKSKAE